MKFKISISFILSMISITAFAQTPLAGTYTIAASGGDFSSFSQAVDSLNANGISNAVTFNVAAGTYEESFTIDSIAGASDSTQVQFVGEDASTTSLTITFGTENPTVSLNGTAFIQFHHLTIGHGGHESELVDATIQIEDGSSNIRLVNCHIISGENVYNQVLIRNAEHIEIDSCQLYDNGFRNVRASHANDISVTNSELTGDGMAFFTVNGLTLINNQFTYERGRTSGVGTVTSVAAFYMDEVSDYYIEKNIVDAFGITRALYCRNLTSDSVRHTIMPTVSNNVFLGKSSSYIKPSDSIKIVNNSFIGDESGLNMYITDSTGGVSKLKCQIENNLFAGFNYTALSMNGSFDSTTIMDYNAYLIDTTLEHFIILHPFHSFFGGAYGDMTLYQADYPHHDQHSRLIDINYLATDDYHINSATEFHFGRNDLGIAEDVEGDPRGLFGDALDVGGDEFAGYLTNIYKIKGRLFLDENGNGVQDEGEYGLANKEVHQSLDDVTTITDENGDYFFYTIAGNTYTVRPETLTGMTTSPTDSTILAGEYDIDSVNFAYQVVEEITAVDVDFTTAFKRCFRTIDGYISYENTGSTQADITVSLTPAEDYMLESADPSWKSEEDGVYYWDIEELNIAESGLIRLRITMPGVDAIGVEQVTLLSAEHADTTLTEKIFTDEIACSYDPNDKAVYPKGLGEDNLVLKTDSLEYLIRFQNTGNDTAFDIRIQDQLSSELDLNSFELISASHDVRTELNSTTNQLIFYFDDILLVDSIANEPESHGYVKYRIKAKENILDSTTILNTAYIYFDFNPPIITNTTSSMMVDEIPQEFVTALPSSTEMNMLIYPNPTTGLINIKLPHQSPIFLEVLSLDGRKIHQHHYSDTEIKLDMSLLPPSMYIVKIHGENYHVQERVIIR